jgi:hypothetical protein
MDEEDGSDGSLGSDHDSSSDASSTSDERHRATRHKHRRRGENEPTQRRKAPVAIKDPLAQLGDWRRVQFQARIATLETKIEQQHKLDQEARLSLLQHRKVSMSCSRHGVGVYGLQPTCALRTCVCVNSESQTWRLVSAVWKPSRTACCITTVSWGGAALRDGGGGGSTRCSAPTMCRETPGLDDLPRLRPAL